MLDEKIKSIEELEKIEKWFRASFKDDQKSSQEMQLIILYKLHQIEERLKVVEYQTKSHWAN